MRILIFIFSLLALSIPTLVLGQEYQPLTSLPGITSTGDEPLNLARLLSGIFNLVIGVAVGLAVFRIVLGGIQRMTTDSINNQKESRATITAAIGGLLLALFSWLLLTTINPNLVSLKVLFSDKPTEVEQGFLDVEDAPEAIKQFDALLSELDAKKESIAAIEAEMETAHTTAQQYENTIAAIDALGTPSAEDLKKKEDLKNQVAALNEKEATLDTLSQARRIFLSETSRIKADLVNVGLLTREGAKHEDIIEAQNITSKLTVRIGGPVEELRILGAHDLADELVMFQNKSYRDASNKISYRIRCPKNLVLEKIIPPRWKPCE